jgi:flagellar hook assembly protein FlgD
VRLRIFDVKGRIVRTLVDKSQGAGDHVSVWDGTDDQGRAVSSGVYSYLLEAPGFDGSEKIVILR